MGANAMDGKLGADRGIGTSVARLFLVALVAMQGCARSKSSQISYGSQVESPVVAMDGNGNGTVVWIEYNDVSTTRTVAAADYVRDVGFGIPNDISTDGLNRNPAVAMDARGNAYSAWTTRLSAIEADVMAARTVPPNRLWTTPVSVHMELGLDAGIGRVSLAASSSGETLLAFGTNGFDGTGATAWQVMVSVTPPDTNWSDAFVLATPGAPVGSVLAPDNLRVSVAMNSAGVGAVSYTAYFAGVGEGLFVHRFGAGADPLLPEWMNGSRLEPIDFIDDSLVVTSDGVIIAFWSAARTGSPGSALFARCHVPGVGWGAEQEVAILQDHSAPDFHGAEFLDCCADAVGNAFVRIGSAGPLGTQEIYSWSPVDGWTGPIGGAPIYSSVEAAFALAANSSAILAGSTGDFFPSEGNHPNASLFDPNGVWSAPREFGTTSGGWNGFRFPVAIDGSGTALCAFITEKGLQGQAWRAPQADFSIDGSAPVAGVPARFTAAPTTIWTTDSFIEQSEWDFDGDQVFDVVDLDPTDGQTMTWTWSTPGTYSVTLRVIDDWGEVGVVTKDVVVGGSGPRWLLRVLEQGGTGVVTSDLDSDGDGTPDIDCPTDCEEYYADGPLPDDHARVYLTAVPDAGYVFHHWEGLDPYRYFDGDYGPDGCLVQMVADRVITAVFVAY